MHVTCYKDAACITGLVGICKYSWEREGPCGGHQGLVQAVQLAELLCVEMSPDSSHWKLVAPVALKGKLMLPWTALGGLLLSAALGAAVSMENCAPTARTGSQASRAARLPGHAQLRT